MKRLFATIAATGVLLAGGVAAAVPASAAAPAAAPAATSTKATPQIMCIYMVKRNDPNGRTGRPGTQFMIWHKNGRTIRGEEGAFRSGYHTMKLKAKKTKARGTLRMYPFGKKKVTYKTTSKGTKYRAKGWQRISTAKWRSIYQYSAVNGRC